MNFATFWAIGFNIILLYQKLVPNISSRFFKDEIFIILAITSLVIFENKRKPIKFILLTLPVIAFFKQENFHSASGFIHLLYLPIGLALFCQSLDQKPGGKKILSLGFFIGLCITCAWSLLEHFDIQPLLWARYFSPKLIPTAQTGEGMRHGILQNTMLSAGMVAALLPFAFTKKRFWVVPLALFCIYSMDSAMATLAAIGVVALFCYKHLKLWKTSIFILVAAIICVFLVPARFWEGSTRFIIWKELWYQESITFWGKELSYFADKYYMPTFKLFSEGYDHPHNEYINILLHFGVYGALIFAYLVSKIRLKNIHFAASTSAVLINAAGTFPFHISSIVLILILVYPHSIEGDSYEAC